MTTTLDDYRALQRPAVTVYSKPACPQCRATKRWLDKREVTYTEVDISEDLDAFEYVNQLGHMMAPVVVTSEGDSWAGYDPGRLGALL